MQAAWSMVVTSRRNSFCAEFWALRKQSRFSGWVRTGEKESRSQEKASSLGSVIRAAEARAKSTASRAETDGRRRERETSTAMSARSSEILKLVLYVLATTVARS